jgi:benzodiazapine receptor
MATFSFLADADGPPTWEKAGIAGGVTAVAALGGLATAPETSGRWYRRLDKPPWQPPGWVFGPVWTVLYALIATSMVLVRRETPARARPTYALYGSNLALNLAWSLIFFRGHSPLAAGVECLVLEGSTLALIVHARPASRLASLCLVPYALWVAFACVLTWSIARRNW